MPLSSTIPMRPTRCSAGRSVIGRLSCTSAWAIKRSGCCGTASGTSPPVRAWSRSATCSPDPSMEGGRSMNATTERAALLEGLEIYDEMTATIDDRTLEILERRRRTAVVKRRGWLVRRMLLLADLVGLATAFLIAELASGLTTGPDQVS